jgi:hypothetical protein
MLLPFPVAGGGEKNIITAVDYLSKWVEARAVFNISLAETIAFLTDVILRHMPPIWGSDQDHQ